jgi:NAD(P)-dependent dehydrogenase (short-subunit alcohol dehydrogenase family)
MGSHAPGQGMLNGKVAAVSGGGSGIGKAAALKLAEQGAKVCLLDRNLEEATRVKETIEKVGGEAMVAHVDISQPDTVEKGIARLIEKWGQLDILFANAGINGVIAPVEDMKVEDWQTTIHTNLNGTFYTVKYGIPHLKKNGGSIIITSSINGNRVFSNFGFSAYSATKAGQVAFMKMTALELAKYKIRVNAVCPGAIQTNIDQNTKRTPELDEIRIPIEFPEGDQPLAQGSGSPEQVADLVLFLASDMSSHITGTEIYIDGAESLLHG